MVQKNQDRYACVLADAEFAEQVVSQKREERAARKKEKYSLRSKKCVYYKCSYWKKKTRKTLKKLKKIYRNIRIKLIELLCPVRAEITVIIPTYKKNDTLTRAVSSVLKQKYPKPLLKILISVNGPDYEYYMELKDKYRNHRKISVIYTDVKGLNPARANAVRQAQTPYVIFLDDDDAFTPGYLATLAKGFVHKDIVVSVGRIYDCDQQTGKLETSTYFSDAIDRLSESIFSRNNPAIFTFFSNMNSKLYRKDLFDGFVVPLNQINRENSEDILTWAQNFSAVSGKIYVCRGKEKEAYIRYLSPDSMSRPEEKKSYDFYVTQRLEVIKELANTVFDPSVTILQKQLNVRYIYGQTNHIYRFYSNASESVKSRAREEIFAVDCLLLNKSRFSEKPAIAFCYGFSPFITPSAFVATKRLSQIDKLDGNIHRWHVITRDESDIRKVDDNFNSFYGRLQFEKKDLLNKKERGHNALHQLAWAYEAFQKANEDEEAEVIYSRVQFGGSHIAAFLYKSKHPHTKWIAEFSDPLSYGVDGNRRELPADDYGITLLQNYYEVQEKLAYEMADVIIFTNENQRQYMMSYLDDEELKCRVMSHSVILHHPGLPKEYANVIPSAYRLADDKINIAYFGQFYSTRTNKGLLKLLERSDVVIHVFMTLQRDAEEMENISPRLKVSPPVSSLEMLNICQKMDYLYINDAIFPGEINPYLPSKLADYLVSDTPILAEVQEGSTLSKLEIPQLIKIYDAASFDLNTLKKKPLTES